MVGNYRIKMFSVNACGSNADPHTRYIFLQNVSKIQTGSVNSTPYSADFDYVRFKPGVYKEFNWSYLFLTMKGISKYTALSIKDPLLFMFCCSLT